MRGYSTLAVAGFGLLMTLIAGGASLAVTVSENPDAAYGTDTNSFGYVSGSEVFGGTGFNSSGTLAPPIDPAKFASTNSSPHGSAFHGVFNITCYGGAADYTTNPVASSIYAVSDAEIAAIKLMHVNKANQKTASVLELRHLPGPGCSSYAHIDVATEILSELKSKASWSGSNSTFVVPKYVHIVVQRGQKIGQVSTKRVDFRKTSPHLHFQLGGTSERDLQNSMQSLHNATKP